MARIVEQALAKLNLGLNILERRPDGFHDLISIFQTVDLYDRLVFEPAGQGQTAFLCNDAAIPDGEDNLVCRAVAVLRAATDCETGVRIALEKRIPVGAGLGGGSSDAAAVLRALNRIWQTGLSDDALRDLGAELGSDVPFFIQPGTALVTGRGERLKYFDWSSEIVYVLVAPGFQISTGWAYSNFRKTLTETGAYATFLNSVNLDKLRVSNLFRHLENDFLPLVETAYPQTRSILTHLESAGALAASMSGSGSTLYGVFDDPQRAQQAEGRLQAEGFRTFLCRPVL